jgi:hypothetical protein
MYMPKTPVSVTLERDNLLWLRGRAAGRKRRSLSDALDEVVTAARMGAYGLAERRSVVGTIDITDADPLLEHADAYIRSLFDDAPDQAMVARERGPQPRPGADVVRTKRRTSPPRMKAGRG